MALIAHYINRGYPLEGLLQLNPAEKLFFMAAWECEEEQKARIYEEVAQIGKKQ